VAESQRDWDEYLPQLACAIRSSVNRHTGMTPNKMMLGREINLPSELIFKNGREELFEHEEQYVTSLRNNIPKNTRNCQENLEDCTGDNEKGL
jgi:hypothetical protein